MFRLFLIVASLFSGLAYGNSIHQLCVNDYAECKNQLQDAYPSVKPQGINWYRFKLYELDSLFHLQQSQELRDVLDDLAQLNDIPLFVQLKMDVMNAKLYWGPNPQLSLYHQERAKKTFEAVLKTGKDPKVLVDYANLHLYLNEYDVGIRLLQRLQERFSEHGNAFIRASIAANLGNFFMKKDWIEKAKVQYKYAMTASSGTALVNLEIVSHYNYARAHQRLEQLEEAIPLFQQARQVAKRGGNEQLASLSELRLGQIQLQLGNFDKAFGHANALKDMSPPDYIMGEVDKLFEDASAALREQTKN